MTEDITRRRGLVGATTDHAYLSPRRQWTAIADHRLRVAQTGRSRPLRDWPGSFVRQ